MTAIEFISQMRDNPTLYYIVPETGLRLFQELLPIKTQEINRISSVERRFKFFDTEYPENYFEIHVTLESKHYSGGCIWYFYKGEDGDMHKYSLSTPFRFGATDNLLYHVKDDIFNIHKVEIATITIPSGTTQVTTDNASDVWQLVTTASDLVDNSSTSSGDLWDFVAVNNNATVNSSYTLTIDTSPTNSIMDTTDAYSRRIRGWDIPYTTLSAWWRG